MCAEQLRLARGIRYASLSVAQNTKKGFLPVTLTGGAMPRRRTGASSIKLLRFIPQKTKRCSSDPYFGFV